MPSTTRLQKSTGALKEKRPQRWLEPISYRRPGAFGERLGGKSGTEEGTAFANGLRNKPLASGEAIRALTEKEPADSPKMVTLSGSPPKSAMLLFTHVSAANWSRSP